MDNKLRVLSIGAGAIGTYIGGSLAAVGNKVTFVDQPTMVERLKANGIHLDLSIHPNPELDKNVSLNSPDVEFSSSLRDALDQGGYDVALFALKSFDTQSALEGMKDLLPDMPPILCLQNGVDNEETIAEYVGVENVLYGTVTSAIGRLDVGDIALEKLRGVGLHNAHPLSARIFTEMQTAGLNPRIFENAQEMKWSKMLTNLISNASSAILDLTPTQIFSDNALTRIELAQLKECLAVMKGLGLRPVDLPGTPVKLLAAAVYLPLPLTQPLLKKAIGGGRGGKMPSFHIDLSNGRGKSEVNYLNGAVVREGNQLGIATPVNTFLNKTLLALTDGSLPRGTYSSDRKRFLSDIKNG